MNILLTGASGFVGSNISIALINKGHKVKSISRSAGVDYRQMQTAEDWLPYLNGIDAVINSVGIIGENRTQKFKTIHECAPVSLFQACVQLGINRVLQISALGADEKSFSSYHLSKKAADDYLRGSSLDWFILRPSLIYGKGSRSADLLMKIARLPIIPIIGDGQQLLQPIHISDVVATVLQALSSNKPNQTLDIVGTEVIPFSQWLTMMRQAQGLAKTQLIHFPFSLIKQLTRIGRYINPVFQPENLDMLQAGYQADVKPIIKFLGRTPRKVESDLFFEDINADRSVL